MSAAAEDSVGSHEVVMLYHNIRVMAHYMRPLDAAMVGLTSTGVWVTGHHYGLWDGRRTERPVLLFSSVLVLAFLWLTTHFRVYHARRTEHVRLELTALWEVLLYATGISCLAAEVLTPGLPGIEYAATLAATSVGLLGARVSTRAALRRLRRAGKDYRVWLVIGRNERSAQLAKGVLANPHFGVVIAQILDVAGSSADEVPDRLARFGQWPLSEIPQAELPSVEGVCEILATNIIDEVVVTLPLRTHYDQIRQLLKTCGEAGISVKFWTNAFEYDGTKTEVSHVGSIPMVTHFSGPSDAAQLSTKRLIDVVGAAAALVVLSPLLVAIALFIKATSRGPVIFSQVRVGLHGRRFRMAKFRTMVEHAATHREPLEPLNETDGVAFKMKSDPRIAPGCRVLRRYHLDELPQLWNVLIGDMSLVGPRPLPPAEATGREWWQRRRLSMPPGLTCFWQAEGDHTIPFKKWMELDLAYIDQWSLWLDLRLMVRTLLALPRGTGW